MKIPSNARGFCTACGRLASSALLAGLVGCASYPMGMSKEQWFSLPPEKQAEYQAQQYRIDAENQRLASQAALERQQQREEAERREQERVAAMRRNPNYRDIITVTLSAGTMEESGKNYEVAPVAFDLVRGETRDIALVGTLGRISRQRSFTAHFSPDGNTLIFNQSAGRTDWVTLVNLDWERGQSEMLRPFRGSSGEAVYSGITIKVLFKPLSGEAPRLILESR